MIFNNIRLIVPDPVIFLLSLASVLRAWARKNAQEPTEELGTHMRNLILALIPV